MVSKHTENLHNSLKHLEHLQGLGCLDRENFPNDPHELLSSLLIRTPPWFSKLRILQPLHRNRLLIRTLHSPISTKYPLKTAVISYVDLESIVAVG